MLNVLVPMAGRGKRFQVAGYEHPKPLIPIHGHPMTEVVIDNLRPTGPHRFVFVILREHAKAFALDRRLREWAPGCEVVFVDAVTEGAACTVLLARNLIDDDRPLMIANCDQWVDTDVDAYLATMDTAHADGLIMTMRANDPKWSYAKLDDRGHVTEVVEKVVVSDEATVGIYNFRRGSDFVRGADRMIAANLRVNGEFYVAPVYNQLIELGSTIVVHNVGAPGAGMYGLGVPDDLEAFLADPISRTAVSGLGPAGG